MVDTGPVSRYGVTFFRRYDGGGEAALSEGLGEGMRSLHAGIAGNADLSKEDPRLDRRRHGSHDTPCRHGRR